MLGLVDVSRYQVERSNPLSLSAAKTSGYQIANVALSGGRGYVPGPWAERYLTDGILFGMGRSTYHWLDGRTPGAEQAAANLARLRNHFGVKLTGFAHCVDVEETGAKGITPPAWTHVRDYVDAMQQALGRHMMIYSGDWYWKPKNWPGADLTPWLMGQPNEPVTIQPAPTSVAWYAGWGGWTDFAVLQWAVRPLPGTGNCSLSLIRDHGVWADLTGGDILMPAADPGNAQPEAWVGRPIEPTTVRELIDLGHQVSDAIRAPERREADRTADLVRWMAREGHSMADVGTVAKLPIIPRKAGESCAPTIGAELNDWISLGGSNLGCVGDSNHGTGFHRGANFVPSTDYSRKRDPNGSDGPFVDWNYACAGDFRHGGNAALRNLGRIVLAELMAGSWTNIGEFIGQPWADRPVMYWNRWTGMLSEYTGTGHDVWFHISWYRSRVNINTHVWKSAVAIRDGIMPVTKADADTIIYNDVIRNPNQRADHATNPTTSVAWALGDMWQLIYDLRDNLAKQGTALSAAIQAIAAKDFVDEAALGAAIGPSLAAALVPLLPTGADVSEEALTKAFVEALKRLAAGPTS